MMKVTLEATSLLMKNAEQGDGKKQKRWLYHFTGLLFTNAKAHLGRINYGGDRPAEVQGQRWRSGEEGRDPAVRRCAAKTFSTTRGDLILKPLREARLRRAGCLTPGL